MDPAAFLTSLVRIGISVPVSACILSPVGQGVLFEDLVDLANKDISTVCSALSRPGEMIPDPPGVLTRDAGIPVSAIAERHLKIVVFLACLFGRRTNRTLTLAMITVVEIQNAQTLMERDTAHHNPTHTIKIGDTKAMMDFFEDPGSFLSNCLGKDQVPFLRVSCSAVTPPLEGDDPRDGRTSVEANMTAGAPHALPVHAVDNAALTKVLKEMVAEFKDAITRARCSFRDRDGCSIMSDWMLHFCGAARQETVEITAEAAMNAAFRKGEKPWFTFVLFTNIHRGCHNEINSVRRLAQPPLPEMDELLKVWKCSKGVDVSKTPCSVQTQQSQHNGNKTLTGVLRVLAKVMSPGGRLKHGCKKAQCTGCKCAKAKAPCTSACGCNCSCENPFNSLDQCLKSSS